MNAFAPINFINSYSQLGDRFGHPQSPVPVHHPELILINDSLAEFLDIAPADLRSEAAIAALAGNDVFAGSRPFAQVYAGHQFGAWNPQLGDGRALLLGEVKASDGRFYDIQLKGSGITPYSRMGDGRSPLGPVLREYLVSEAMAALGVPTTRSLAAVTTGEPVYRETRLPGAILTRVASSHIRVGTFQYFAAQGDADSVRTLADYLLQRHYPQAIENDNPYQSLLDQIIERQAQLISQWMTLGFIHGVMNTDNMLLCGETIDYGPCAFMDAFDEYKVFSSIDQNGRYAYRNQPAIAQWNLAWFAQTLMPLIHEDEEIALSIAQESVSNFKTLYDEYYGQRMAAKLGYQCSCDESDSLSQELLQLMSREKLDFTLTFRHLADSILEATSSDNSVHTLLQKESGELEDWIKRWRPQVLRQAKSALEIQQQMYQHNPALIPRNHLVEEAIRAATDDDDFDFFHGLVAALAHPHKYHPKLSGFAKPPTPEQEVKRTFCGT